MRIRLRSPLAILGGALTMLVACSADASATPQQLDCVLTDTEAKPGSESRPIVVVFDQDKKTLTAQDGSHNYSFSKITITYISISGQADDISLGIDRSSLGIVWQQYGADKMAAEFGHCHPAPAPK